ncbi:MAG: hypothetical protein PHE50_10485 [Dehalococcoidales bacterium]|nr:hypothetical protein [Dehalococcoidales bacterium]
MPDKTIITLEAAQIAAERFLEDRLKKLKKLNIEKLQLSSVEGIVIYMVEGKADIGGGLFTRRTVLDFKIQVAAADGAIVGYETTGVKTE